MRKPNVDRRTFLRMSGVTGGGLLMPAGVIAQEGVADADLSTKKKMLPRQKI